MREPVTNRAPSTTHFRYPGPDRLPFDHQDLKVYIDNLFLEGKLTPVEAKDIEVDAESWVRSGIATSGVDDDERRIARLFGLIEKELPTAEARYSDWTAFALKWAELSCMILTRRGDMKYALPFGTFLAIAAMFAAAAGAPIVAWYAGFYK